MPAPPPPGWYPDPWTPGRRWWDGSAWTLHVAPGGPVAPVADRELAPVSRRLLAQIVDGLVLTAGLLPVLGLLLVAGFAPLALDSDDDSGATDAIVVASLGVAILLVFLALFAAPFLYQWLMLRRDGQTVGKKALGIRVVRLADNAVPTGSECALRVLVTTLLSSFYIDVLWCLWDTPWRQCLHDKAVGTIVVPASAPYRPAAPRVSG